MNKLFSNFKKEILVAPIIVLLFFIQFLVQSKLPIPADNLLSLYHPWRDNSYSGYDKEKYPAKNPLVTDPILQTYPWKSIVVKNMKNLNLPLWDPYSFSGQPLLANIQSSALQINNIFYYFLPFNISWTLSIIICSLSLTVFMYLFLKSLDLSYMSAIFGATVIGFTAFFTVWLTWGNIIQTAIWLPLILFLINELSKKTKTIYFLILVFAYFQTLVSGHIQTSLYVLLMGLMFTLYKFILTKNIKLTLLLLVAFVFGVLASAVQLLPTLEFANLSNRSSDLSYYDGKEDWFIPFKQIIQIIIPDFFGNPTTNNYFGIWNYSEFASYIGIIPLYFALLAIIRISKRTVFFLAILVFSILFATSNPVSKIPYNYNLPFLSSMQPSRLIFLIDFSLVVLASIGIDHFLKNSKKIINFLPIILILIPFGLISAYVLFTNVLPQDQAMVSANNIKLPAIILAILIIIVIYAYLKLERRILFAIILTFTIFELFRFSYKFTPFSDSKSIFPTTKITDYLQSQPRPFRIMTTDRRIMSPNISSYYDIESVSGYNPLYLKNYGTLIGSFQQGKPSDQNNFNRIITPQDAKSALINLLNVKYIVSFDLLPQESFESILEEGKTKLYLNKLYNPRFYFPEQIEKTKNDNEELEKLINNKNFTKMAYSTEIGSENNAVNSKIKLKNYTDNSINLETETDKDAYLFLSNIYYPGWVALIDNQKTPIYRTNFSFQSVLVRSGKHDIIFEYLPQSFSNGLYLSAISVLLTLVTSFYLWRKKLV